MAQGIINVESKFITYTEGGSGTINFIESISSDLVSGDLVSFDVSPPFATNIQKVSAEVVVAPSLSAQQINQLDDGCLFSPYVARVGDVVRVRVDDETDDDARKAWDLDTFWRKVERGRIILSASDRTMVEETIASMEPGIPEGQEIRLWVSEEAYPMAGVTLTTVYRESGTYNDQGVLIPAPETVEA